jgi:hypothetical protein
VKVLVQLEKDSLEAIAMEFFAAGASAGRAE